MKHKKVKQKKEEEEDEESTENGKDKRGPRTNTRKNAQKKQNKEPADVHKPTTPPSALQITQLIALNRHDFQQVSRSVAFRHQLVPLHQA